MLTKKGYLRSSSRKLALYGAMCYAIAISAWPAIVVNDSVTAAQLAAKLIEGQGCIIISNATYSGSAQAKGIFSASAGDNLGITSGIILSSGKAQDATGPNNLPNKTTVFGTPGDTDLTTLAAQSTFDAAVLEFDFGTSSREIEIKFVFGSEEYLEYIAFNDVFAFYINGQNIAVLPASAPPVPISVSSINPDQNAQYYRDNPEVTGDVNVQYDGLTVVMTVYASVAPNTSHHAKLAIADGFDAALDSSIFIASFKPSPRLVVGGDFGLTITNGFVFGVSGYANSVCAIHASSDLVNWTSLGSVTLSASGFATFIDTAAYSIPQRFYRMFGELPCLFLSVNSIGYIRKAIPPGGFDLVLNPFELQGPFGDPNTLNAQFHQEIPVGAQFFKYDPTTGGYHPTSVFGAAGWSPNYALEAGEGGFIQSPASGGFELRMWGQVPQGQVQVQVPSGWSIRGSRVPQTQTITVLGYPVGEGDSIDPFDPVTQGYVDFFQYVDSAWEPYVPSPVVGGAFFVQNAGAAKTWTRNFSVW
jgi:hypothetical protein